MHEGRKGNGLNGKDLLARATGKFYTHELTGRHLAQAIVNAPAFGSLPPHLEIVEPFCGDGRMVCWLLEAIAAKGSRGRTFSIEIWDSDAAGLEAAGRRISDAASTHGLKVSVRAVQGDSFTYASDHFGRFHICITNPPWENLKPDRRELESLEEDKAAEYVDLLKQRDILLSMLYPLSQPRKKFSGWGTNLARCGTEVALRLTAPGGVTGIVSPASLLADQMSPALRKWIFQQHNVTDLAYYVAEARLFEKVDQPCITFVAVAGEPSKEPPAFSVFGRDHQQTVQEISQREWGEIERKGYVFPLQFGFDLITIGARYASLPRFGDLERADLWAGRELDETNHAGFLGNAGQYLFLKGRMIRRFGLVETPTLYVKEDGPRIPRSADHYRIVWRDVSRPNQKRRVHATIIPPRWVTGNSLHVAYFEDDDLERLKALLAVMNSFVFESQARAHLATAHVSLGVVRSVHIPPLDDRQTVKSLAALVDRCTKDEDAALLDAEVAVARLYGLQRADFEKVISSFEKVEQEEKAALLAAWDASARSLLKGRA